MVSGIAQKPTLALIHGWGIGASVWQPVTQPLATHFEVRLLNLPGYAAPDASKPSSFVQTAEAFAADLPEKVIVCGWSLGAMLAMQMALLAPQRIARLILVSATPSFMQRADWSHAQPPALLDGFRRAVTQNANETRQRFVALLNQGDSEARALTRSMTRSLTANHSPDNDALLVGLDWLRDVDLRSQVAAITTPTLIIHGENDPLMPVTAAQILHAQLASSQLEVFASAAHAPFVHDPERFIALLAADCHATAL